MSCDGRLLCRLWFPRRWICSFLDLSLLVNLASVEFVSSTNQSLLGFNRSGGSPVWAPQNVLHLFALIWCFVFHLQIFCVTSSWTMTTRHQQIHSKYSAEMKM
ncbi:uncharacterized protein [Miscanthus floridulus]|uniref:uncharacterized protein isoform X2 n=1 Tax=Miscanthus floridulus TaxID=154761 RepID=UPI00345AF57D